MDETKGPFSMDSILPRCNTSSMCMESFSNVTVELQEKNLWREFHAIGNEMIITKNGRNLFPVLSFDVKGLDADAQYYVLMEMCLANDYRYKFSGSEWKTTGRAETQLHPSTRTHIHTDSPASGAHWMRETIKMKSVKITNNPLTHTKHLVLTSMHKYIPKIHIIKTSDSALLSTSPRATFLFAETEFIAVTAYQNEKITQLKIYNNPFAKGFRESGLSNVKKRKEAKEEVCRKRRCSDGTSVSSTCSSTSLESLHILPQPEDVNNNHRIGKYETHSQDCHYMLEQKISSPLLAESRCCDLPTRVSSMDMTSSSLPTTFFRSWETPCEPKPSTWRFPYLLPPPPPLFPTYPPFLNYPYNHSLFFPHQAPPSPLMDLSMQPKDYSIHSRTS